MVRQTKRFKKGLNKKVLSAILAASMIMTSSSFAFAQPMDEQPAEMLTDTQEEKMTEDTDGDLPTDDAAGNSVAAYAAPLAEDAVDAQADVVDTREIRVTVNDDNCVYNGDPQKPDVTVEVNVGTDQDKSWQTVEENKYRLEYSNNIHATTEDSKAKVTVVFTGEVTDDSTIGNHENVTQEFEIQQLNLTAANVDVEVSTDQTVRSFLYNGKKQYPTITSVKVKVDTEDGTKTLSLSEDDYEVGTADSNKYDLISVGKQWLRIYGKGDYTGYKNDVGEYDIQAADLSEDLVNIQVKDYKYTGKPVDVNSSLFKKNYVTVTDIAGEKERPITEFNIEIVDNDGKKPVDIGTYTLRIRVNDHNFTTDSYIDTTFNIVESESLESVVMGSLQSTGNYTFKDGTLITTYNGKDQYLEDSEINFGTALKDADYEIVTPEAEWVNAGEYEIVIEGRNIYAGQTVTVPVKIQPKPMVNDEGKLLTSDFEVTATQGKHQSGNDGALLVYITDNKMENIALQEGVDYTYVVNEKENDISEVVITGIGNYTTEYDAGKENGYIQTVKETDTLDLNDPSISVEVLKDFEWTGKQIKPGFEDLKVTEQDGTTVRTLSDSEYSLSYGKNTDAGEGTIILSGKTPNYSGTRVVTFKITGTSVADTFNIADVNDFVKGEMTYGEAIGAAKITYKANGAAYPGRVVTELYKDGKKISSYKENDDMMEIGSYTIVKKIADGQYEGELKVDFNVIGNDLKKSGAVVADIEDQVYTSEAITPTVTVKVGDKTLKAGEDYEVTYTDNVKGGEATAIITGINNYSGTLEKNFNITRAAQGITMTNPLQERDLGNGSRTSTSKVCTLKLATTMADEDTKFTYTTSDPSVATVNDGKITYRGVGECTITVSAAATDSCEAASLPIKVVVGHPGTPTFTPSVTKNTGKKAFVVTSSTVRGADGFEVQYSIRDDFWKATTKDFSNTGDKLLRQTCKTVHSNMTYYVRVRAYQTVDGEKVYSTSWSPVKTIKTK